MAVIEVRLSTGRTLGAGDGVMVYSIGRVSIFGTSPRHEVIGEKEGVWDKLEFLHPESVDRIAKARRYTLTGYGYPLVPDSAPQAILWKSKTKLPADYAMGNNQVMLVSERFRDLVEHFEPGVHQFLPVEMLHARGEAPFATFYWFICCQLIDSLDPQHTSLTWDPSPEYYHDVVDGMRRGSWYYDHSATPKQVAVFSLKAIGNRHLWRDPYYTRDYVNCSDAFGEAMQAAKLSGFGLMHFDQV